jgi:hypothetical protein
MFWPVSPAVTLLLLAYTELSGRGCGDARARRRITTHATPTPMNRPHMNSATSRPIHAVVGSSAADATATSSIVVANIVCATVVIVDGDVDDVVAVVGDAGNTNVDTDGVADAIVDCCVMTVATGSLGGNVCAGIVVFVVVGAVVVLAVLVVVVVNVVVENGVGDNVGQFVFCVPPQSHPPGQFTVC